MQHHVGIDFGTTNTAIGLASTSSSDVHLAALPGVGHASATTWRTVLYFEPDSPARAGAPAIDRYLETGGDGRLIQSIKSHLASSTFTRTSINGRNWNLENLIAEFLRQARRASGVELGRRAVVGRPVRYWGAEDADDDARALSRMRTALTAAGFEDVVFEYEPIAAAVRYAATIDHDQLILVADFGGGTSDFSLVRVGPNTTPGDPGAILGTGGIGIGGDSFDARIIDAVIAPAFGQGTTYEVEFGAVAPVPSWLFGKLRRWHYLSFLKAPDTVRLLERIAAGASAPERIERLVRVVHDDLGLSMHRSVERAKVGLSAAPDGRLELDGHGIELDVPLRRPDFEDWIVPELDAIDQVVTKVLDQAGVVAGDVDAVFATGGSSLVPAVRQRLATRFGAGKLAGGDELTSVAWGLAARARQLFA